jgi:hypothetical protein
MRRGHWLSAVRWLVGQLNPEFDTVVMSLGMMTAPLVEYWARQRGVPIWNLPTLCADEDAIQVADHVVAIAVRAGGRIERQLLERLTRCGPGSCWVWQNGELTSRAVMQRLLAAGAMIWNSPQIFSQDKGLFLPTVEDANAKVERALEAGWGNSRFDEGWLFHWTREPSLKTSRGLVRVTRNDEWWIKGTVPVSGPLAALWHLVCEQRLRAHRVGKLSEPPVVCFTECPPENWPQLRRFQSHRTRWDFESYGLAFRRDSLIRLGAEPVIYGTMPTWQNLPESKRPFFQKSPTLEPSSGESGRDWRYEREWRVCGDVDLRLFSETELQVFAPSIREAHWLQAWSRWPVRALPAAELGDFHEKTGTIPPNRG